MTTKPVAGARIRAVNTPAPYLASAACSSPVTVSSATATDITGASISVTSVNNSASVLVIGVFDIQVVTSSGVAVALGSLVVDGSTQSGQAIHDQVAVGNRGTVTQVWNVILAAPGAHTIKLQAALSGAAGSSTFNATHTTISASVYDW